MDKAQGLIAMIFVFLPIVIFSLLIGWAMDDERTDKKGDQK